MEEIKAYIKERKGLLEKLLEFIDSVNDDGEDFFKQISFLQKEKNEKNKEILRSLLIFIINISQNHYRNANFFKKLESILLFLEDMIKKAFSNTDIFKLFQNDDRILLFLFEQKIISLDKDLLQIFLEEDQKTGFKRIYYLYPSIKDKIDSSLMKKVEKEISNYNSDDFERYKEKCYEGENDSHICSLIRKDSLDEFIIYVNQKNYSLTKTVERSLFETNLFLKNNPPTLIEYAAFFGSIQIFQYLKMNKALIEPSIWHFAIHGRNPDLIHLIEGLRIIPDDETYQDCLQQSVKCFHNEIANYIQDNLIVNKKRDFFYHNII